MPVSSIKGPDAEGVWARASKQAEKQYPGLKSSDSDKFYAIVMTIYKSMCLKSNCTPKAEQKDEIGSRSMKEMIENVRMDSMLESMGLSSPKTARDWSLYDGESPDAKARNMSAVRELNAGMRKAAGNVYRRISKEIDGYSEREVGKAIGDEMRRHVFPVMDKYSDRGAADTEPKYLAVQAIIDMVKKFYDIDGFTGLGDYV